MIVRWFRRLTADRWNARQGWRFIGAYVDGGPIKGLPGDLWQLPWHEFDKAHLREPRYGEQRLIPCYRVESEGREFRFAATEFSNGIWGFYLPLEA